MPAAIVVRRSRCLGRVTASAWFHKRHVADTPGVVAGIVVDLSVRTAGGLVPPVAPTPLRQIFLLQRKTTRVGAGLGKTSGWVHRAVLQRNGVQMLSGVDYQKIDDQGLHISVNGVARLLEVDHVVLCAGQEPLTELLPPAGDAGSTGPKFHRIGGAALASELDAKRAIREGALLACSW